MNSPKHVPQRPRLRAAGLRCARGSSSLLRLSQAAEPMRLPRAGALECWLRRAAVPLSTES